jgi:hypothetical protein
MLELYDKTVTMAELQAGHGAALIELPGDRPVGLSSDAEVLRYGHFYYFII